MYTTGTAERGCQGRAHQIFGVQDIGRGFSHLVIDPDSGPGEALHLGLLRVVLVRGGLQGGGEENPQTLLGAVTLVGIPLPVEEEVVGHLLRASVAGWGGAVGERASYLMKN